MREQRLSFQSLALSIVFAGFVRLCLATATTLPSPPAQPTNGPGSSEYGFGGMVMHRYGSGDTEYWIFEPAKPTPDSAPVVIFLHGWSVMTPNTYGKWVEHLVRRGNIVIYPRYQSSIGTLMKDFTPNAIAAVKAAFAELQSPGHVKPQLDHVAVVGHSLGGAITANLAADAAANGLPVPKAFCCVEPGNHLIDNPAIHMPVSDLSKIPPATLGLVIVGDRDELAGTDTAQMIFNRLGQIPSANKNYVTLISDDHGSPPLVANHMCVVAGKDLDPDSNPQNEPPFARRIRRYVESRPVDALEFYGAWKLFDGLTDAAFYGRNREYALGNTLQQRFMGVWGDGAPVKELEVK
jgi:pimeloyl-ACP methyl ester carboxylesterase